MNIELTQEQVAAFNRGESITITPKPKQWEPSEIHLVDHDSMRVHDRLLAYVREFGGDWVADWDNFCQDKYSVTHKNTCVGSLWSKAVTGAVKGMGTVYMSRECMNGLITKLNSGEVVL
tara:strand:- start:40 stop:396 length:357 start_codon:yes stop_codon:yes gene_type:complete